MNTGKLNRRIIIVTSGAMTSDVIGGFTEGIPTQKTVWCAARQLSMAETLSFGLETTTESYQFNFLYFSADDLTRIKELIYKGSSFRIAQVKEVDEAKREIHVIASKRS